MKIRCHYKVDIGVSYNDRLIRILAAVFAAETIVSIGRTESPFEMMRHLNYWIALAASIVIASATIETVYLFIKRLDRKFAWEIDPLKRVGSQAIYCIFLPVALAFALASIYYSFYGINIFNTYYMSLYFPVNIFMILLLNAYYIIHYGVKSSIIRQKITKKPDENEGRPGANDVVFIFCRKKIYFAVTQDNAENVWPYTMEETIGKLPAEEYFFIKRSCVVKQDNIKGISPASSRRLILTLKIPDNKEVVVSQRNAPRYREMLENYRVSKI